MKYLWKLEKNNEVENFYSTISAQETKQKNKQNKQTNKKQHNLPTLTFHERNKSRKKEKTDQNKSN